MAVIEIELSSPKGVPGWKITFRHDINAQTHLREGSSFKIEGLLGDVIVSGVVTSVSESSSNAGFSSTTMLKLTSDSSDKAQVLASLRGYHNTFDINEVG
jgi:hypothetical protein